MRNKNINNGKNMTRSQPKKNPQSKQRTERRKTQQQPTLQQNKYTHAICE
jgi:hypothetical protein